MNHKMFTIYDSKAAAYLPPFILPRPEMAQRLFSDSVNNPVHQFGKNPEDYTLFLLGDFDDATSVYTPENTPISLGLGVEYVKHTDVMAMEGLYNAEESGTEPTPVGNGSSIQPSTSSDDPTE